MEPFDWRRWMCAHKINANESHINIKEGNNNH